MLRFILEFILALLAFRLIARALRRIRPNPRPFDPGPARGREKSRDPDGIAESEIVDAEYEELPRK